MYTISNELRPKLAFDQTYQIGWPILSGNFLNENEIEEDMNEKRRSFSSSSSASTFDRGHDRYSIDSNQWPTVQVLSSLLLCLGSCLVNPNDRLKLILFLTSFFFGTIDLES